MKSQEPAEGIMKTNDFGSSVWYRVSCQCGQPDHALDVEVEATSWGVEMHTHATVKTDYWGELVEKRYDIKNPVLQRADWLFKDIVNGLWRRLKLTWKVWAVGYLQAETTLIMTEQQARNFAQTIENAADKMSQLAEQEDGNSSR